MKLFCTFLSERHIFFLLCFIDYCIYYRTIILKIGINEVTFLRNKNQRQPHNRLFYCTLNTHILCHKYGLVVPSPYLVRTLFDCSSTVLRLLISRTVVEQQSNKSRRRLEGDSKETRRRYDDASKKGGWSAEEAKNISW